MPRLLALVLCLTLSLPANAATWGNDIIYFVMIDRFADGDPGNNNNVDPANPLAFHGGDLKGLAANLGEIADLGATAIWITPVARQIDGPIDSDTGFPFFGHHGYWAEDLAGIDPRYGDEADLKSLVEAAHERGLKVILDVVYNHVGYGASMLASHPDWVRTGDDCGGDDLTMCLSGLPDLRTELPEVQRYLFDTHIGLAERTDLDGFRLDTVKHISHDFWADHANEVHARLGDEFLLLGEIWDGDKYLARPYLETGELDAVFDFKFRENMLKFLTGVTDGARLGRYLAKRHDVPEGTHLAHFLSNHDMPMLLAMLKGDVDRLKMAFVAMMASEGIPVISWGEELGRKGGIWPDNREDMPWGERDILPGRGEPRDEGLQDFVKGLIEFRKTNPELASGHFEVLQGEKDFLAFRRGAEIIVALNRGQAGATTDFLPGGTEAWEVALSTTADPAAAMDAVPAGSAVIFKAK